MLRTLEKEEREEKVKARKEKNSTEKTTRAQMKVIYSPKRRLRQNEQKRGEIHNKGYSDEMARRERLRLH